MLQQSMEQNMFGMRLWKIGSYVLFYTTFEDWGGFLAFLLFGVFLRSFRNMSTLIMLLQSTYTLHLDSSKSNK